MKILDLEDLLDLMVDVSLYQSILNSMQLMELLLLKVMVIIIGLQIVGVS